MNVSSRTLTLHADKEHEGLRSVVVFQLFVIVPLSYWGVYTILNNLPNRNITDYAISLSCVGGLALGLGVSWIIEQLLKRVWHSGQALTLTNNQLQVTKHHKMAFTISPDKGTNQLGWYFPLSTVQKIGRERRLPKKWLCFAYQVLQEENRVIVYTYASMKQAEEWLDEKTTAVAFHELDMQELFNDESRSRFSMPKVTEFPAGLLAGKDGRYWAAERHRNQTGMELTSQDFATLINWMKQHDPQPTP